MKKTIFLPFLFLLSAFPEILPAQNHVPARYLDSLVKVLVHERRNWNEASQLLIAEGEPAVDPLLKVLNDKNLEEWPRRKAAFTLAGIPSQRIVPACVHIFQDTAENRNLRFDACRALKGKDITPYEKVFLEAIEDENPFIRLAAMRQIWTLESDEALETAFQATGDENNLIRRGGYEYLSHRDGDPVDQIFLNGLVDPDWYVREYIFSEMLDRAEKLSGKLEKIALNTEYEESVRWSAVMILRKNKSYQDIGFFFRMLAQNDWMIRNEAAMALLSRKDLYTWEDAASLLENLSHGDKYPVFWLIGKIGDEKSVSWLESRLDDPDCASMAAVALGLTGSNRAMNALTATLEKPDINLKRACLWALTCLGPRDARLFIPFLNHEDPEIVRLAITGLQRMGTSCTPALPAHLE